MVRRMETVDGHLRPDVCPALMGSAEVLAHSKLTAASALFYYRDNFPDWPKEVAILGATPVYLREEIVEFFKNHPPQTRLTKDQVEQIRELTQGQGPGGDKAIAERFKVSTKSVAAIRRGDRKRPSRAKPKVEE